LSGENKNVSIIASIISAAGLIISAIITSGYLYIHNEPVAPVDTVEHSVSSEHITKSSYDKALEAAEKAREEAAKAEEAANKAEEAEREGKKAAQRADAGQGGYGYLTFDGGEYSGEVREGIAHGHGKLIYSNSFYIGEFQNNSFHGYGVYRWDDDPTDSDLFKGEFINNSRNGYGVYRWKNGNVYKGEHINSIIVGYGIFIYSDSSHYDGEFEACLNSGFGVRYKKNGEIDLAGEWQNDKFIG